MNWHHNKRVMYRMGIILGSSRTRELCADPGYVVSLCLLCLCGWGALGVIMCCFMQAWKMFIFIRTVQLPLFSDDHTGLKPVTSSQVQCNQKHSKQTSRKHHLIRNSTLFPASVPHFVSFFICIVTWMITTDWPNFPIYPQPPLLCSRSSPLNSSG